MNIKNIGRAKTVRTILVGTGVVAAVALVGCGAGQTASGSSNSTTGSGQTVATSTNAASTGGTIGGSSTDQSTQSAQGAAAATAAATQGSGAGTGAQAASHVSGGIPECKANTLALSFGGSDAGMNQQYQVLRFTNTGKRTCAIVGFPGVSYVAGDNGTQVGAAAVRDGKIGAQINLAPGQVASTVIHSVDPGVFDPSACKPTAVRGFRVYAPDDFASMFIALPSGAQGCAGTTPDPQLSVPTISRGLGNPDTP